jgi:16S rRNA (guanine966-N2)-methyltransferase
MKSASRSFDNLNLMRVIAGKAKGSRLKSPVTGTRPMTDRMKEAIFSALGDIDGDKVLDLYAGSGALGLEALSRGGVRAVFVESSREAITKLEQNLKITGLGRRAGVEWIEVGQYLRRPAEERMDLIFVDPPYSRAVTDVVDDLEAIVMGGFLAEDGRIVLHRPAKERTINPLGLDRVWDREYGQSRISVFTHEEDEE